MINKYYIYNQVTGHIEGEIETSDKRLILPTNIINADQVPDDENPYNMKVKKDKENVKLEKISEKEIKEKDKINKHKI